LFPGFCERITQLLEEDGMRLTVRKIPDQFLRAIPRGFRLVNRQGHDFLLIESLFCPNGHNLVVDSVRIHDEASIKLKVIVGGESGFIFVDAFWGSHEKLYSFIPRIQGGGEAFAEPFCPYCDAPMLENYACTQKVCGSAKSVLFTLPGGKNRIHVCARLGCPGHVLEIKDMPDAIVRSVNTINYFGAGIEDLFVRH
jgi:hypothetical protein